MAKERCGYKAVARACWPGQDPIPVCELHKQQAVRIGRAMGAYIPVIAPEPSTLCTQMVEVGDD